MTASEIIKQLKERGFSKWRISKECGVTWQTVHMWEKGVFNPSKERLGLLKELVEEDERRES